MAANASTVKVTFLGDATKLAASSKAAGASIAGFGAKAKVALLATGAAAAAIGVGIVKLGASFDDAYDTIRVGTGATGKDLDKLKGSFKNVVSSVPTDFGKASTAIADLNTRTGLTGKPLEKLSKQMLEMTRLTGGDLSGNIAGVTRVFGDWSISTGKQSDTMDYLFKVSQSTGIGIESLSSKVVQFGAPLRQLGFDFETSAAMLGKWEKEGVNTEAVLAGMKIGLGKLSKAGKEPVKALADVSAAIKGAGTAGEANRIAIETFGQRAGPDMAAAIREGRFDLDELMATLKASPETIMGAAKSTESFGEKWQVFKNKVLVGLEPLASRAFTAIGNGMDRMSRWWDANGEKVKAGFSRVRDAMVELGDKVRAGAETIIRNWDDIKSTAQTAATILSPIFAALIVHWAAVATAATVSAVKQAAAWVMTQVGAAKSAVVHGVTVAAMVAGWVLAGTTAMVNGAKIAAGWLLALGPIGLGIIAFAAIGAAMVVAWKKSETFRGIVRGAMGGALDAVKGFLGGIEAMLRALGKIPGFGWADTAADKVRNAANAVGRLASRIREIKSKTVTVTVVTTQINNIGRVPHGQRAHGGPVLPGRPYLVGERGPEMIVPKAAGTVLDAKRTAGMGGGPTYNLHISGTLDASVNERTIQETFRRMELLAGTGG